MSLKAWLFWSWLFHFDFARIRFLVDFKQRKKRHDSLGRLVVVVMVGGAGEVGVGGGGPSGPLMATSARRLNARRSDRRGKRLLCLPLDELVIYEH